MFFFVITEKVFKTKAAAKPELSGTVALESGGAAATK
jgi:hypothetical protein